MMFSTPTRRDLLKGLSCGFGYAALAGLAAEAAAADPPDWAAVQEALDTGLAGSAYLLAVLSDDLYASRADLWLWSAAPGPTRPARRRISLGESGGLDDLANTLDQPLLLTSPWVGIGSLPSGQPTA